MTETKETITVDDVKQRLVRHFEEHYERVARVIHPYVNRGHITRDQAIALLRDTDFVPDEHTAAVLVDH